jgi:hypothetical protein
MTNHTWRAGGSNGRWVLHSTTGHGSDGIGVGAGEDYLGPLGTQRVAGRSMAEIIAAALTNAYLAGLRDGYSNRVTEESA